MSKLNATATHNPSPTAQDNSKREQSPTMTNPFSVGFIFMLLLVIAIIFVTL